MFHSRLAVTAGLCIAVVLGLVVLRFVLHRLLPAISSIKQPQNIRDRVLMRYQGKDFNAWMFARFKTYLDAMFTELPEFLKPGTRTFLDLGCGFGIASCFVLELFESATAYAADPNGYRVGAAAAAVGDRGHVFEAGAPGFEQPDFPPRFDAVLVLDMIQFLRDTDLDMTLKRILPRLGEEGLLIIRSPVRQSPRLSCDLRSYTLLNWLTRTYAIFRTVEQVRQHIRLAGFEVGRSQQSGTNPELFWFIASPVPAEAKMQDERPGNHHQNDERMNRNQPGEVQTVELIPLLQKTHSA